MSQGEFRSGGVTPVKALPTASSSLEGKIFFLLSDVGAVKKGYYNVKEDGLGGYVWSRLDGAGQGKIFISAIEPTPGQVSKTIDYNDTSSGGYVIEEATGNTDKIRVHVRAISDSKYMPEAVITARDDNSSVVASAVVNFSAGLDGSGPEFEAFVDLDVGADSGAPYDISIAANHDDGASDFAIYHVVFGPVITNATFVSEFDAIGSGHTIEYPLTDWGQQQSEVKQGDVVYMHITADPGAPAMTGVSIYADANGLATNVVNLTFASTYDTYIQFPVTNTLNVATQRGVTLKAHKADLVFGEDFTSTSSSNGELTTLLHNNISPSITLGLIDYPGSQGALKDNESGQVSVSISNADTTRQPEAEPVGTSMIVNSVPPASGGALTASRNDGAGAIGTLEDTDNLRIRAFRTANGRISAWSYLKFWIHDDLPTAEVIEPATRLRSGGNDGTAIQSHSITLGSMLQSITTPPTLELGHVPVSGGWANPQFSGSGRSWSSALRVHDNDPKGAFTWGVFTITNRANRSSSIITGNQSYTLGGFVERTLTIDPGNPEGVRKSQIQFGTFVLDPSASKLVCYNGGELGNWGYSSSDTDQNDKFTILDGLDGSVALVGAGNVWASLDANYHDNRTQPYTIRLEEIV